MTKMSFHLNSILIFLSIITSGNSLNTSVCELISNEGKLREVGLYERFDRNGKNPSYWLYARNDSISEESITEYELKFSPDWNFNVSQKGVDTFRALHKFSIRRYSPPLGDVYYNCSVRRDGSTVKTKCSPDNRLRWLGTLPHFFEIPDIIDDNPKIGGFQWIAVQPLSAEQYVFAFHRNDNTSHFVYSFEGPPKTLDNCSGLTQPEKCQNFFRLVEDTDQALISNLMAVLPVSGSEGNTGYFFLFNISGRPKYCISKATNTGLTSDECKTSERLKPFLSECFPVYIPTEKEEAVDSTDPLIWVMIVLTVIGGILSVAVCLAIDNRHRKRSVFKQ